MTKPPRKLFKNRKPKTYILDFSPNNSYFHLYEKQQGGVIKGQVSLSTQYSKALVKALFSIKVHDKIINKVPDKYRVMCGLAIGTANRKGITWYMPLGRYCGESVRYVADHDKEYLIWFWNNVTPLSDRKKYKHNTKWREGIVEAFAYILWYVPELAEGIIKYKGKLFKSFHYEQEKMYPKRNKKNIR